MKVFGKIASAALLFCLTVPAAWAAGNPDDVAATATGTRALSLKELHTLYDNRSWIWKDGAGFFRVSKREFTSWVRAGKTGSFADGRWFLTNEGKICFRAMWNAKTGSAEALTCFEHRTDGRNIYQRRLPEGEWYVFRHQPVRSDDEARKLKHGDYVSKRYLINKRYLETH